ncbi:hypothetical protein [Arthrobacter sp. ok362]|uniref:hypothetical protein n=1 Tax=Arthrobacter sp. ok362 TaxID=1761745 RepID=UPI00088498CF|nr:hypothetical protein [Arthrobacter sp. ok362]SDL53573.1 hypothetical protein SAMN04487913_110172 [Arthrobacter sp. ok362]
MKRRIIRLGVAGTLAALAVSAVGIPAQAADTQPAKPGLTTEAASLPAASAPAYVELQGFPEVGGQVGISHGYGSNSGLNGPTKVSYQWLRNGVAIPGATGNVYKVGSADVGKKLSYRATFSETGRRSVTLTSNSSPVVPSASPAPIVTGTATVGNILRGTQKEPWAMTVPVTVKYQWLRNGSTIPGATSLSYKLTKTDLNALIVLRAQGVSGGKVVGSSYAMPVKPSTLKQLTISPQPIGSDPRDPKRGPYSIGLAQAGYPLILSNAVWKQAGAKNSIQWLRNGAAIPGATGTSYTLTAADVGSKVTAMITGSLKGYADTIVAVESFNSTIRTAPAAGSVPSIAGKATVGSVLTATYKKDPKAVFVWTRNYRAIAGATKATYKLTSGDKGALISVATRVTVPNTLFPEERYSFAVVPR